MFPRWAAASFILTAISFAAPSLARAQETEIPPHQLQVIQDRGLIVYQLRTNEGIVIVTLPDGLKEGDIFSGSIEMLGTVSSTATLDYRIALDDQRATVRDGAFHWRMPENLNGYARLRFLGSHGDEIAAADVPILSGSTDLLLLSPDHLGLPTMVQANAPLPVFGPFDGDSRTTSVQVGGQNLRVIAEMPGRAIVDGPKDLAGVAVYQIKKGAAEAKGETRVIAIDPNSSSIPQRNGKTGKLRIRMTGLEGITQSVPIRFEIAFPQTGAFEPDLKRKAFVSPQLDLFIEPKDVKAGGYSTERTVIRFVDGPLDASARLVIPVDLRDIVAAVLLEPQQNYREPPWQQHFEALQQYGDAVLPVLAEFLTAQKDGRNYDALNVLFLYGEKAAPFVIGSMPHMGGQALQMSENTYTQMALDHPEFRYRKELLSTITDLAVEGDWNAIYCLGKIGSQDDVPLLESVYRQTAGLPSGDRARKASEAALARFGVKQYIDVLVEELAVPVKTEEDAISFEDAVARATYADRAEFIPPLCLHIGDPGWWHGDYGEAPAASARGAIASIAHKRMSQDQIDNMCKAVGTQSSGKP